VIIHGTGNKQIKAATVHHSENEGLAERGALPARGISGVCPAAPLFPLPTSAGGVLPQLPNRNKIMNAEKRTQAEGVS